MKDTSLDIARQALLDPVGMNESQLETVLAKVMGPNIDEADLYLQFAQQEAWSLEDGIIKSGSFDISRGVGVRAISGEKSGYAYAENVELPALEQAAIAASSIAKQGQCESVCVCHPLAHRQLYPTYDPLQTMTEHEKVALLQQVDTFARAEDSRVKQVNVSLSGTHEIVLMLRSDGQLIADVRPMVRLNVSVIAQDGDRREQGYYGGGGRSGYEIFSGESIAKQYAQEAVRQALVNLQAKPAPAGVMPVVLGPGWPGVLLHEAIGHGLEGDFNRKGSSAFSGRLGERVAAKGITVVDDGTLPGRRGSLNVDDEGTISQCTVLIEDGLLKNYMHDRLNAKLMGMEPTGNGRRESYASQPIPRMTNTYMLAGKHDPQEIIATVQKGLYAVNFDGGQVDITSGKFVFSTAEAYLIENGKVTHPVKGATLIGDGPDVLTKVSMVGNDLALDTGIGICGKDGQSVPVGVGQPTLKVDALTVGGTN